MRVPGEGPRPCRVMFVAEHPGKDECAMGRPCIGRASTEFNRYLDGHSLPHREDVFITNLVRLMPEGKQLTNAEILRDEPELWDEIIEVEPEIIVAVGAHSAHYFLGNVSLEMVHGIPHRSTKHPAIIFPTYHFAAAIHAPELAALYAYDMQRLSLLLKGRLPAKPVDDAGEDYRNATSVDVFRFFERWLIELGQPPIGCDTEGWVHNVWSAQIAQEPGKALVIRANNPHALEAFRLHVNELQPTFAFHQALHDLPVLRALDIHLTTGQYTDTSIMAYLLGIEPQGAKPLFYRHAGMEQDSYADITYEAGELIARGWLQSVTEMFPRWPGAKPPDIEKTLRLVDRMLKKDDAKDGLRARWSRCRAKEVLQDELELIGDMPEPTLDDIPLPTAIRYSGRDADGTARIVPILDRQIEAMGLRDVLNADLAALPMIDRMQTVGMEVDLPYFEALTPVFQLELDELQRQIDTFCGRALNPSSGDQVAEFLFGDLGLKGRKKTKSGERFSTDDKTLEAIRKDPLVDKQAKAAIELIQDYREVKKLITTYCVRIPEFIAADGRIHPQLRVTKVATGRLSAVGLNLLAFPKHSARGKLVRGGFRAGTRIPGRRLKYFARDLSQVEMRVFAIESLDERMIEQFLSGHDFHTVGAAQKLKKLIELVTKEERFGQKAVNFGVLMGITEHGLLDQYHKAGLTHYTLEDMVRYLAEWFASYPNAKPWIESKHAEARRYGFVRDMWGRLRYIPGVRALDPYVRSAAERDAQSTPIQSGAQGLVKRWMASCWNRLPALWERDIYCEPILQTHDELIFEGDENAEEEIHRMMTDALDEWQMFPVPITSEGSGGERWSDL